MRLLLIRAGMAALVLLVTACSSSGSVELTLVAQNVALGTQIAEVRTTATYETDRLMITMEYVQTAITEIARQNQALVATLSARGETVDLSAIRSDVTLPPAAPIATQAPVDTSALGATPETGSFAATTVPVTPISNVTGTASLFNVVTARGVGDNDCALSSVTAFTPADTEIYVVATASSVQPGMTLTSRWFSQGSEAVVHSFTPDFVIDQACVWFYIDQSDTAFTPGQWSVQLEVDGVPSGAAVAFNISES